MNAVMVGEIVRQELAPPADEILTPRQQIDRVLFLADLLVTAETALAEIPNELVANAAERHIASHYKDFDAYDVTESDAAESARRSAQIKDKLLFGLGLSSDERTSIVFGAQLQLNGQAEAR